MTKLIIIDDDPTGSQTVHSCLLLLSWRVETLVEGLQHPANVLFILANTRALPPRTRRFVFAPSAATCAWH